MRKQKLISGERKLFFWILFFSMLFCTGLSRAEDKIKVVTSLPDLADIAKQVGGEKVEAFAIAKGYQDPHFVDAKPSYMIKLQNADMFVQVGLDLEIGWVPPLLEGARNKDILWGGSGYVDASKGINLLQVPHVDPAKLRAEGDIHIYGNPHYWLDPQNGKIIAENIFNGLVNISPENEAYFNKNLETFKQRIDEASKRWSEKMQPYHGTKIYAYHNSWPYFEQRYGLKIAGFVEPKPGIPPSPKYLVSVIQDMKSKNVKIIIIEPYFPTKSAELVAKNTGAIVVEMASEVGAQPGVDTYFDMFDYNVNKLIEAFKQMGITPEHSTN